MKRAALALCLAASWAMVMIVTGLILWWPRGPWRMAGTVYPRLSQGGRVFWKDLHSVTGLWISGFVLVRGFYFPFDKERLKQLTSDIRYLAGS